MSHVELIPINKGNPIAINATSVTTIGRSSQIACSDNKISRNHAQLYLKSNGTVWIKSIHHNPTFFKTKTNQIVSFTRDKEYQLNHDDQFGLLPDEYFYRVSIKTNDEEEQNSSTIPKTTVHQPEPVRTLPADTSDQSSTTDDKNLSQSKANASLPVRESTPTDEVVDDKNDAEPAIVRRTTEEASTSNETDETHNRPSPSTVTQPKRERCPFGASCYRTNPIHRQENIHPGDSDWDSDDEEEDHNAKPLCPYGNKCYRTNPDHLNEYDHFKARTSTRQTFDEEDDEDLVSTDCSIDQEEADEVDDEWKPDKDPRYLAETDDESSNESDKELAKKEAEEFIRGSTVDHNDRIIKKPRVDNE